MGKKKSKQYYNEALETEKYNTQLTTIKNLIDEKRPLNGFSQILDQSDSVKKNNTEIYNYVLTKCLNALKSKNNDVYYYLSILYYLNEKLKIVKDCEKIYESYKKTFNEPTEKEKIIIRELNILTGIEENVILPEEVATKFNIDLSENNIIFPNSLYIINHEPIAKKAITIDPSSENALKDDAISIEEKDGNFILGIHISDVTKIMKPNSILDTFTKERFRTLYLPDKILNMFPDDVSQNLLSLEENVTKAVISLYLIINKQGVILSKEFKKETIQVEKNLTYCEAEKILNNESHTEKDIEKTLKLIDHVLYLIDSMYGINKGIKNKEENELLGIETHRSMEMIQTSMILYNHLFAKEMENQKDIPFIYRVHKKPIGEKVYKNKNETHFFEEAYYSLDNIGHFGLSLTHYAHATAGIRRYMDYVSQQFFNISQKKLTIKDLKELEKNVISLVEYANEREKEIRMFLPEYAYSYHKTLKL